MRSAEEGSKRAKTQIYKLKGWNCATSKPHRVPRSGFAAQDESSKRIGTTRIWPMGVGE